jgi:hypothetical protein
MSKRTATVRKILEEEGKSLICPKEGKMRSSFSFPAARRCSSQIRRRESKSTVLKIKRGKIFPS